MRLAAPSLHYITGIAITTLCALKRSTTITTIFIQYLITAGYINRYSIRGFYQDNYNKSNSTIHKDPNISDHRLLSQIKSLICQNKPTATLQYPAKGLKNLYAHINWLKYISTKNQ